MSEPVLNATYLDSFARGLRAYTVIAVVDGGFTLGDESSTTRDVFWVHGKDPKDAVKRLKAHKDLKVDVEDIAAVFSGFHSPERK